MLRENKKQEENLPLAQQTQKANKQANKKPKTLSPTRFKVRHNIRGSPLTLINMSCYVGTYIHTQTHTTNKQNKIKSKSNIIANNVYGKIETIT